MQMKISATINRLVDKPDSNIKAFASVSFDGFYAVHGIKQYQDIFHPISKGARNALNQAVLNAYDIKLQQVQQTEIEVENSPDEEMSDDISDEPEPEISM